MEAAIFFSAPAVSFWLARRLIGLYCLRGAVKPNYRGKLIAPALGPALLLGFLSAATAAIWLEDDLLPWLQVTALFMGVSLYGSWDDFLDEPICGFKGHFRNALKGGFSAGLLKVITALPAVLIFSGSLPLSLPSRISALFLILLSANGVNLLDRRPGRALKVFFSVALFLIFAAGPNAGAPQLLLPLMAAALALAPLDFSAEGMLGDCGANLLGAALGVAAVLFLQPPWQLFFIAAWGAVNLVSERISISRIIEKNSLLRYLDGLGREEEKLT
jgi:UDP-N-acetylmuramyl pentapeptide phosphotransferase/UDP-N-acetylglucosamine-1-phosphate transferase